VAALSVVMGLAITVSLFTEYIEPWEVGVKKVKFLGKTGIQDTVAPSGTLVWQWPMRDEYIHVPIYIQKLEQSADPSEGSRQGRDDVTIPTSDGSQVYQDVTNLWRVVDGPTLVRQLGANPYAWENKVRQTSAQALIKALGPLTTQDFYNAAVRDSSAEVARNYMNNGFRDTGDEQQPGLSQFGIRIERTEMRRYNFIETIDNAIRQKVRKVQETALAQAEKAKNSQLAQVARVTAEGDADIAVERQRGESEAARIRAEGNSYLRKMQSEGDKLVQLAEAERKRLASDALQSTGANYAAMRKAELLEQVQGGVLSEPEELRALMESFSK